MRRDTYERAVRSAVQVSFLSLPLIAACGSEEPRSTSPSLSDSTGDAHQDSPGESSSDNQDAENHVGTSDAGGVSHANDAHVEQDAYVQADSGSTSDGSEDCEDGDAGSVIDCAGALSAAYPEGDPNWYDALNPTPRTDNGVPVEALLKCCEQLGPSQDEASGGPGTYRNSGCCSLGNETGLLDDIGLACTPWGPPMPRAMVRSAVEVLA